jgi:hypothetical protein
MIIKQEKKGNVIIYYVDKDFEDDQLTNIMNTPLTRQQISHIIDHDADVYTAQGKLLLKFRKNKLNKQPVQLFYDNIIDFAKTPTNNRGSASGSKNKNVYNNPKIMTNIVGYFDKLSPKQKYNFKLKGIPLPKITVRETRFLQQHPDKFQQLIPLIQLINQYYKQYIPDKYQAQYNKAKLTPFHIADTAFTTVTTNVNYSTTVHTDTGDDIDGFGNLTVIQHGLYDGAETCFPQYGIGVDVRTYDVLYMDVHVPHANLPIIYKSNHAIRLSIVCYLRISIFKQTRHKSHSFMKQHIQHLKIHSTNTRNKKKTTTKNTTTKNTTRKKKTRKHTHKTKN